MLGEKQQRELQVERDPSMQAEQSELSLYDPGCYPPPSSLTTISMSSREQVARKALLAVRIWLQEKAARKRSPPHDLLEDVTAAGETKRPRKEVQYRLSNFCYIS